MDTRARCLLGAAGGLAYAVLSHQLMTRAADQPLALLALLGPMAGLALLSLWRGGRRVLAALLGGVCLALAVQAAQGGRIPPQWLYLGQHAGIHFGLGVWFASTLRPGRQPLISALAERTHGGLSPALAGYTRKVTAAWCVYFAVMTSVSLGLYAGAPFEAWSLFANVLTPLSLVLMFAAEYLLRYRLHPEFERVGITAAIHAWNSYDPAQGRGEPQ
ncbi:hypothetical protein OOT46_01095 [Aquabacterium sp. A7-Y]|uniref:COG4648 family protein n=1 Tax=Aquabacterium sp. A7-Y TaxID=1349605 RepID=UPI00223D4BE5|nr:hypothetical protein [Aquabacterium sp. A7-Y]MCW7536451.1 hypothetical protein [Aquabacterium sp. A7-Y]